MYWLRWLYHVKDIAGAAYTKFNKTKKNENEQKTKSTIAGYVSGSAPESKGFSWYLGLLSLKISRKLNHNFWVNLLTEKKQKKTSFTYICD